MAKWTWERLNPDHGGAAGDITKLFRAEPIQLPGVLARGAPSTTASLMAREVIQNSWDSGLERRDTDPGAPPFELTFEFTNLAAPSQLGLEELAERSRRVGDESGLISGNALESADIESIPMVRIEERGTTGMGGSWSDARSKLYLALVSIGFTEKASGAGGSYGYGKAGMIRASRLRTVIAYTCFRESRDEPDVTRRFLGMTYWRPHELDGTRYTGFGRFGKQEGHSAVPFENDDADRIAQSLGLGRRSADDPDGIGTTLLVLDPLVEPDDLVKAIEYFWWPALETWSDFVVTIIADGETKQPRPRKSETLRTFIRGFELATTPQDNKREDERCHHFNPKAVDGKNVELGTLGLKAAPDSWSYPAPDDEIEHQSLVALVRGPRMVIAYQPFGKNRPPYVRGTFVAADEVDEYLRQTEPKAHDGWLTRDDDGDIEGAALDIARTIERRIRREVNDFRNALKPPVSGEGLRLPVLDRLFRSGTGGKAPEPTARDVNIRIEEQRLIPKGDQLSLEGRAAFSASSKDHEGRYSVSITYKFLEDGASRTDCPLTVTAPTGWTCVDGSTFQGRLAHDERSVFLFRSDPYDPDWSGKLVLNAHPVTSTSEPSTEERP